MIFFWESNTSRRYKGTLTQSRIIRAFAFTKKEGNDLWHDIVVYSYFDVVSCHACCGWSLRGCKKKKSIKVFRHGSTLLDHPPMCPKEDI